MEASQFDPDDLWQTKVKRFTIDLSSSRNLQQGAEHLKIVARHLKNAAQMQCFDDLRVDMVVDELQKCWIVRICSLDFMSLKPAQEYTESPNKAKYLKVI
jgi:hypothetical protein